MTCQRILGLILLTALLAWPVFARETIVIAGAGPSTVVVTDFFGLLSEESLCGEYAFVVPERSIKHAGGIQASDTNLFGRTGRPLTQAELDGTRAEIFLARIPLTFIIDPDLGITAISLDQLQDILQGKVTSWKEIGGPDVAIKLVGREPTEAALMALTESIPEMAQANFDLRLTRDHQLLQMMNTEDRQGVLGFGAASNFTPEMCLKVGDLDIGLAMGLVYNKANSGNPLIKCVESFAASEVWRERVVELGFFPINQLDDR